MNLSAPRQGTFLLGLVLWILALVARWSEPLQMELGGWPAGYLLALIAGAVFIVGITMRDI